MKVTVTGHHIDITPALRARVQARVEHSARYPGPATEATVVLSGEKYRHQAVYRRADGSVAWIDPAA
jgi:ribosomal subunit interface protein